VSKDSSDQADQIRAWLKRAGFKLEKPEPDQSEQWFRKDCDVRLIPEGNDVRIQLWHRQATTGWRDLDEVVRSRASWPEAAIIPPLELATAPLSPAHKQRDLVRHAPGTWLYQSKPWAYGVKVFLQMLVGIGAVVDIGMHVAHSVATRAGTAPLAPSATTSVKVIAYALAVAAAIELAYTLFTPGPDEALDPLMLGLSSGILLLITAGGVPVVAQFSGVLIGVVALAALFLIRRYLVAEDDQ
jgi:hypothetical protein